jgi:hypothetical protein
MSNGLQVLYILLNSMHLIPHRWDGDPNRLELAVITNSSTVLNWLAIETRVKEHIDGKSRTGKHMENLVVVYMEG